MGKESGRGCDFLFPSETLDEESSFGKTVRQLDPKRRCNSYCWHHISKGAHPPNCTQGDSWENCPIRCGLLSKPFISEAGERCELLFFKTNSQRRKAFILPIKQFDPDGNYTEYCEEALVKETNPVNCSQNGRWRTCPIRIRFLLTLMISEKDT